MAVVSLKDVIHVFTGTHFLCSMGPKRERILKQSIPQLLTENSIPLVYHGYLLCNCMHGFVRWLMNYYITIKSMTAKQQKIKFAKINVKVTSGKSE